MILERLFLTNFRNHKQRDIELPPVHSPFYLSGSNGAGKTSVIEAIYLLYTLRTFRSQPLTDLKSFGEDFLRVNGTFSGEEAIETATLFYQQERKFLINGQADYMPVMDYSYITPVICYSPSFETVLSSEHSERRQSLDRIIYYTDKSHMTHVKQYNLLLLRKRAELEKDQPNEAVLSILNEQLAPLSDKISAARERLVAEINKAVASVPEIASVLMPELELSISANRINGRDFSGETEKHRPLYGAHKDLLYVKQQGKVIEKFQSYGQKKSCLLFLLYHMATIVRKRRKSDILLLFDDFEAGLDETRADYLQRLITSLMDGRIQVVLSGIVNRQYSNAVELKL